MTIQWIVRAATGLAAASCQPNRLTEGLTTPPSKIEDFAHLPLHRGGFVTVQNHTLRTIPKRCIEVRSYIYSTNWNLSVSTSSLRFLRTLHNHALQLSVDRYAAIAESFSHFSNVVLQLQ